MRKFKSVSMFVGLIGLLLIVSCGRSEREEAQSLESEGRGRLNASNTTISEVARDYQLNIAGFGPATPVSDWSRYTLEQRKVLRKKLTDHKSNVGRILEIGRHKNMKLEGAAALQVSLERADELLKSMDAGELVPLRNGLDAAGTRPAANASKPSGLKESDLMPSRRRVK